MKKIVFRTSICKDNAKKIGGLIEEFNKKTQQVKLIKFKISPQR